jgi:antitoxin component of RelBE/YafQ-DinJ toxin-antitoxin module
MRDLYRTKFLYCRLSESEEMNLKRMAEREGINLSECVRLILREASEKRGLPSVGTASSFEGVPTPKSRRK